MRAVKLIQQSTGICSFILLFFSASILYCQQSNIPPSISITTPTNGASFSEPANIAISAVANDVDGAVTEVEFYNGTTKIGEDTNSENGTGTLPIHWHETKGFGTDTKGGIAGAVYKVTNLNSSGTGSLSDAVSGSNRLVVFEVGGVIDIEGDLIIGSNITIAGQTAPYPGITTIKGRIIIYGNNVVVSHITHQMGTEVDGPPDANDAWNIIGSDNIVLDHVAVYWGKDETLPVAMSTNVTLYKCIIAEGLQFTGHSDGEHSKGLHLQEGDSKVSVIAGLQVNTALRSPRLDGGEAFLANWILYNWGPGWDHRGDQIYSDDELANCPQCYNYAVSAHMNADITLVGCVGLQGPESIGEYLLSGHYGEPAYAYMEDNIIKDRAGYNLFMADPAIVLVDSPRIWPEGMQPLPADEALYEVLRTAGPQPGQRTTHIARVIKDVADGIGEIIDSEDEVGGYPNYPATYRPITVPDGAEARQAWLDSLEDKIAVDTTLDLSRLYTMVGSQASDKLRSGPTDVKESEALISTEFNLEQNYPNPFNPLTRIEFSLPERSKVKLEFYNILGRKITTLVDEVKNAGKYSVDFDGSNLSSGFYVYKLTTANNILARKMLLTK